MFLRPLCERELWVGVNWNQGLMRWKPHVDGAGKSFPLNHLHPFRFSVELKRGPAIIAVAFAMHCFTRHVLPEDAPADFYADHREKRTFCRDRYQHSRILPGLVRALADNHCRYAKNDNYVVIEVEGCDGVSVEYGVFFNVKRWRGGDPCILLTVQSAYVFDPGRPLPGRGKIHFRRLVELTLDGIRPKPPR